MSTENPQVPDAVAVYETEAPEMGSVPPGYKMTEVGMIPEDWDVWRVGEICDIIVPGRNKPRNFDGDLPWITTTDLEGTSHVSESKLNFQVSRDEVRRIGSKIVPSGSVIMTCVGEFGNVSIASRDLVMNQQLHAFIPSESVDANYLSDALKNQKSYMESLSTLTAVAYLNKENCNSVPIPLPPLREQHAIATALSDVDDLISALDKLIAKKRALKTAAMQQLLTGKWRLPGFSGEWETKTLQEVTDCLDNLRIPLNEAERAEMRGRIPYCGANGILDRVDDYVIDDDIILIAEDGGHFEEFAHRPIAYRMSGKCWVNNHAHILKSKDGFDQDFIFYSLVHKDILTFLASGTRAKLNKSEMYKIEVSLPCESSEQTAIVTFLSDMDAEIEALEARREKTQDLKQGMMQELLTGRTRLV